MPMTTHRNTTQNQHHPRHRPEHRPAEHPDGSGCHDEDPSRRDRTGAVTAAQTPLPTPLAVWACGPFQDCPEPANKRPAASGLEPDVHEGWPPCGGQLPDRLLYRAVAEFSRPGDLVLVGDDPRGTATAAALDFDRQVLTRAGTARARRQLGAVAARYPDTSADSLQVSTDFTTWRLPAHHRGAALLLIPSPCPSTLTATAHASPHLAGHNPAGRDRPSWDLGREDLEGSGPGQVLDPAVRWQLRLLGASLHLLRPGGLVLLVTGGGQREARFVDRLGQLTGHATGDLHLGYLQHLIGICTDLHDGQMHPRPPAPDMANDGKGEIGDQVVHEVVHADLLLFTTSSDPREADDHTGDDHD